MSHRDIFHDRQQWKLDTLIGENSTQWITPKGFPLQSLEPEQKTTPTFKLEFFNSSFAAELPNERPGLSAIHLTGGWRAEVRPQTNGPSGLLFAAITHQNASSWRSRTSFNWYFAILRMSASGSGSS